MKQSSGKEIYRMRDALLDEIRDVYAPQFHVTAIYNEHADADDARRSTAQIPPRSMVFVEGMSVDSDPEAPAGTGIGQLAGALNGIRSRYGIGSAEYTELKQTVIDCYEAELQVEESVQFAHHTIQECLELVKKDCFVVPADYDVELHGAGSAGVRGTVSEYMKEVHATGILSIMRYLASDRFTSNSGAGRHYKRIFNMYADEQMMHGVREKIAATHVGVAAKAVVNTPRIRDQLARRQDGRYDAYVIYGVAHRDSLTHQLHEFGFDVEVRELISIPEHQYLAAEVDVSLRQRIGHALLVQMAYETENPLGDEVEFSRNLYESAERLNQDPVLFRDVCIRAIKAIQAMRQEQEQGWIDASRLAQDVLDGNITSGASE